MHKLETILMIAVAAVGMSCATTRVVKKQPGRGGEIMVHDGIFGDARADAGKAMKANCAGKKVRIVEEGEAVVGSRTHGSKSKSKDYNSTSSYTEDEREWRIKYKCGKAG